MQSHGRAFALRGAICGEKPPCPLFFLFCFMYNGKRDSVRPRRRADTGQDEFSGEPRRQMKSVTRDNTADDKRWSRRQKVWSASRDTDDDKKCARQQKTQPAVKGTPGSKRSYGRRQEKKKEKEVPQICLDTDGF